MSSIILLLLVFSLTCGHAQNNFPCFPSSCGNIKNITFPFRLKDDPRNCGNPNFELHCQNNQTILNLNSGNYYVQSIDYDQYKIQVVDSGLEKNNPCSFPLNSTEDNISSNIYSESGINVPLAFIQCPKPVNSPRYVNISFCSNGNSGISSNTYRYIVGGGDGLTLSDMEDSCSVETVIRVSHSDTTDYSSQSKIHEAFAYGIEFSWIYALCRDCYGHGECSIESNSVVCRPFSRCYESEPLSALAFRCRLVYYAPYILLIGGIAIGALFGLRFLCGITFLIPFLVHKWRRRKHFSEYESIDPFEGQITNFKPIRYSYSQIKKMTNNFKERLGTGTYGNLFKGKLRSGPPITVRLMHKSISSPQEFVNVVSYFGKIRHGNVLQLIGFCFEGENRALVFDFMPNGSIQKESFSLSYEKMFEISIEVARGIDYLHRKYDSQASHIGIKPHNVLLDENLSPKISDFAMVKLCPGLNYMAPEFYYKNLGEISYKSDVYSYGVLLMEMVRKSKFFAENKSRDLFNEEEGVMEIGEGSGDEEMKMVKKMMIVGMWCIQMVPEDRPTMDKVVEMLQGDVEILNMPPKASCRSIEEII